MHTADRASVETMGQILDGIHVGMCVFDAQDRVVHWNHMFLRIFPEHVGHVHVGENYRDNLRRFYQGRMQGEEASLIDHYIEAGVTRHRVQMPPYVFEHREQMIEVSSLPEENGGRIRVWRTQPLKRSAQANAEQDSLPGDWLDGVPDGLMVCASDGLIQWVNESFVQMYGLPDRRGAYSLSFETVFRALWIARNELASPQCQAGLHTLREHLRFNGAPFELALPGNRFCRVIARPAAGGAVFFAHVDITQLKRQQQQLERAERIARDSEAQLLRKSALLEATLESMQQGVAMISAEGVVEVFNQRAIDLLGLPRELLDRHPTVQELVQFQRDVGGWHGLSQLLQDGTQATSPAFAAGSTEQTQSDGQVLEVGSYPVRSGGLLYTLSDITERKRHEQRIEYLAHHDGLTGLLNRGRFMEYLATEVATLPHRPGAGCAVFFLDLDGFKPVNDQNGHAIGDKVLEWVALQLRATVREGDHVARIGGDEFAVLQREVTHADQVWSLAKRLHKAIGQTFTLEGRTIQVGVSIGVALCPEHGDDPQALLRRADKAMYEIKSSRSHAAQPRQPAGRPP